MTRASVAVFVSVALTGQPIIARANGEGALGPPMVFERFGRPARRASGSRIPSPPWPSSAPGSPTGLTGGRSPSG